MIRLQRLIIKSNLEDSVIKNLKKMQIKIKQKSIKTHSIIQAMSYLKKHAFYIHSFVFKIKIKYTCCQIVFRCFAA